MDAGGSRWRDRGEVRWVSGWELGEVWERVGKRHEGASLDCYVWVLGVKLIWACIVLTICTCKVMAVIMLGIGIEIGSRNRIE